MANREYNYAVGRRKETTATVKLYAKGAWNYLLKTASGKEYTLADYFGGNQYLLQIATSPFSTLGVDVLKKEELLDRLMLLDLHLQEHW